MIEKWQFVKDAAKFSIRRHLLRLSGRQFPIEELYSTIEVEGFTCRRMHALEVFGKHGLWHTKAYLDRCQTLDLWEINPKYANLAIRLGSKVHVICGDSIRAIRQSDRRLQRYDVIVVDNPSGPFGEHCEHFDLFPWIFDYLNREGLGLVIVNFLTSSRTDLSREEVMAQSRRREGFYGRSSLSSLEALGTYAKHAAKQGMEIRYHAVIPRNAGVNYLAMIVKPGTTNTVATSSDDPDK